MDTWQFILQKFVQEDSIILLYVLQSNGSSPGRQGFKMAVSSDGDIFGTIGGGIMEHKFVELSHALLKGHKIENEVLYHQVHDMVSKNRSGMICSGDQTLFVYRIQSHDINEIQLLISSLQKGNNGLLQLTLEGIKFVDVVPEFDFSFVKQENNFCYEEKTGYKNILHIIGGGHCSLALSRLMRRMDFHISVYDEREGLNTISANLYAHNIQIISSYSELSTLIEEGKNVYVAIMTFGYRTDDTAVRALVNKKFKYIGLLGSKNKIKKMFEQYEAENMNAEWLNSIHSPIGISIKSETVEEIAISIAAEIISLKNVNQ